MLLWEMFFQIGQGNSYEFWAETLAACKAGYSRGEYAPVKESGNVLA
jgi:hypothetical protein